MFKLKYRVIPAFIFLVVWSHAQESSLSDTTYKLPSATVKAYLTEQPPLRLTTSLGHVDSMLLRTQQGNTLLPAINTVPGVRMEERSPGSYRLSIRGSLLRSPFGVRNVKIYYDELPLTDAGGNTYLNLIDPGALQSITILKGPDGSLYGANSGGVVLISPGGMQSDQSDSTILQLQGGSYGLFHQQFSGNYQIGDKYRFQVNQAHLRSDGFRDHTAMRRTFLQTVQRFQYHPKNQLRLIALYSDMEYQTPGGLTPAQFAENPWQARPATPVIPGSVEQQAGIYNKTLYGGLIHESQISNRLRHVAAVFGSYTDFRNPFITNYEKRFEDNIGLRTYLDYIHDTNASLKWRVNAGVEWQRGHSSILNYDNLQGERGGEQAGDALRNGQHFYFARISADLWDRLYLETALSLNYNRYGYRGIFPIQNENFEQVRFQPAWMPRFALSYLLNPAISVRASLGKGYSPATTAEVRSSDNIINTSLLPETGWNREIGLRYQDRNGRLRADVSYFNYRMQDAIVRQLRENGAEFFTNAGEVKQRGFEAALNGWLVMPRRASWIRGLQLGTNITFSHFRFGNYSDSDADYSGNRLTGAPSETVVSNALLLLPRQWSLFIQHNYTSSIPLNDENTFYADRYHLIQAKLFWKTNLARKTTLQVHIGADNMLNQTYSLGNDINAFGNRFYNASLPRNYFAGLAVGI